MTPAEFRDARLKLGLTQVELGRVLGIAGNSVWRKEHGQQEITERDVLSLRALKIPKRA